VCVPATASRGGEADHQGQGASEARRREAFWSVRSDDSSPLGSFVGWPVRSFRFVPSGRAGARGRGVLWCQTWVPPGGGSVQPLGCPFEFVRLQPNQSRKRGCVGLESHARTLFNHFLQRIFPPQFTTLFPPTSFRISRAMDYKYKISCSVSSLHSLPLSFPPPHFESQERWIISTRCSIG
jgi:hypothetical protein